MSEEQLNLWPYIRALFRYKFWIVGATILTIFVTYSIITLLPPSYKATTLITIVNSEDVILESLTIMDFDPQFSSVTNNDPLTQVYPELATSDKILADLLLQLDSQLEEIDTVEKLRRTLSAQSGNDSTLLQFDVHHPNPELASEIANRWAELFIPWANELFNNGGEQQLNFFQEQLEQTKAELQIAESNLADFQGENRFAIINNTLNALLQSHTTYQAELQNLQLLNQNVQALREKFLATSSDPLDLADQITALNLQFHVFNIQDMSSFQLQLTSTESFAGKDRQEQLAFLDNLLVTLERKNEQINDLLSMAETEILLLQQQYQEAENKQSDLLRQKDSANEAYIALARRVAEERISAQDAAQNIQLASQASIPSKPIDSNRLLNSIVAGAVTFLAASFFILATVWWQQTGKEQIKANDE